MGFDMSQSTPNQPRQPKPGVSPGAHSGRCRPGVAALIYWQGHCMKEIIRKFNVAGDREQVVHLWRRVFGYESAHNAPQLVLDKKLAVDDGLLFVAEVDGKVVGSVMAGYDGHRGWIYSLAVLPEHRRRGLGSRLVRHAEEQLKALGCPKINLQIMKGNEAVESFYRKLGYESEQRISMGKKLLENISGAGSGAAPDGGPAMPLGKPQVREGPPSVS